MMAPKYTVLIAAQQYMLRQHLIQYIAAEKDFILLAECEDCATVVRYIQLLQPDLCLMEAKLAVESDFVWPDNIGQRTKTVLLHEDQRYALDAIDHGVFGYVITTALQNCLQKVFQKYRKALGTFNNSLYPERSVPLYKKKILVEQGRKLKSLDVSEISHIKANRDYSIIYSTAGNLFMGASGISSLEKRLNPSVFLRVHRSWLINLEHIVELYRDVSSTFIRMPNAVEIKVGRSYLPAIKQLLY